MIPSHKYNSGISIFRYRYFSTEYLPDDCQHKASHRKKCGKNMKKGGFMPPCLYCSEHSELYSLPEYAYTLFYIAYLYSAKALSFLTS